VESQAPLPPTYPPSPSSFLPPWPWGGEAKGHPPSAVAAGRALRPDRPRGKGGGRGGGVSGGKGGPGLEEGVHGLGPCTTPSLGCPPKDMLKLDHFSISFGDFSFFL
jgi:hypothetical protein